MPQSPALSWRTERRRVRDLLPFAKNPRKMSAKQRDDLLASLKKFNLVEIPAITPDGRIVAGHQRCAALQMLGRGDEEIEVRVPSRPLSEDEYRQYLLASNAIHGDWDVSILAEHFEVGELAGAGFSDADIAAAFGVSAEASDDGFDAEAEARKIKTPKSKVGDLYLLGRHRLIVGDATDAAAVRRLTTDTRPPTMVYLDPPFNIGLSYDAGLGGKSRYGGQEKDRRSEAEYQTLLSGALSAALEAAAADCHVFMWGDVNAVGKIQSAFAELGAQPRRTCLWIKGPANPTPGIAFNRCYEPCVYGTRGKPFLAKNVAELNEILNPELGRGNDLIDQIGDLFDLWLQPRDPAKSYAHPTQKPVALHGRPIRRCTQPGDGIIDLFGGSGSTMVAAEQTGRTAYLAELDPVFADVIIARFERLTGLRAQKADA